ncbi:MAG: PKD domain-containing protein, partial [bacterium]
QWTFDGSATHLTSAEPSPSVAFSTPGGYSGSLVVANAAGSSAPFAFTYTVSDAPPPDPPVILAVAPDGSDVGPDHSLAQFNASFEGTATSWTWDFGGGATLTGNNDHAPQVQFGEPGTYSGTVTACNAGGCSAAVPFSFTVHLGQFQFAQQAIASQTFDAAIAIDSAGQPVVAAIQAPGVANTDSYDEPPSIVLYWGERDALGAFAWRTLPYPGSQIDASELQLALIHDQPILCWRRYGATTPSRRETKLAVLATPRPTSLDSAVEVSVEAGPLTVDTHPRLLGTDDHLVLYSGDGYSEPLIVAISHLSGESLGVWEVSHPIGSRNASHVGLRFLDGRYYLACTAEGGIYALAARTLVMARSLSTTPGSDADWLAVDADPLGRGIEDLTFGTVGQGLFATYRTYDGYHCTTNEFGPYCYLSDPRVHRVFTPTRLFQTVGDFGGSDLRTLMPASLVPCSVSLHGQALLFSDWDGHGGLRVSRERSVDTTAMNLSDAVWGGFDRYIITPIEAASTSQDVWLVYSGFANDNYFCGHSGCAEWWTDSELRLGHITLQ